MTLDRREYPVVFLVGCARSGTTWLQLLLAQHPAVATAQETHLFSRYLAPWHRRWESESNRKVPIGLCTVMSREEFVAFCEEFAWNVLDKILRSKQGASIVLEKTPDHAHHLSLILETLPRARIVHLVRDPRAVVASILAAHRSWGSGWAPAGARSATEMWLETLHRARSVGAGQDGYTEVRYEDLHERPAETLAGLLAWIGLPASADFCREAIQACSIRGMRDDPSRIDAPRSITVDIANVYRVGKTDGWREELRASEVRIVEHLAREEMKRLGYAFTGAEPRRVPLRLRAYRLASGLRDRVERALGRWVDSV